MKLSALLDRLKKEHELAIAEHIDPDGVHQFIIFTKIPFPKNHWEWYVFTLPKGVSANDFDVEQWQIDTMLRHLWMFQLQIGDEEKLADEEGELVAVRSMDEPLEEYHGPERRKENRPI